MKERVVSRLVGASFPVVDRTLADQVVLFEFSQPSRVLSRRKSLTFKMTMGDHGHQMQFQPQRANQSAQNLNSPNKYPYNHVTRSANKMLASYSLPGQMMHQRANNNNNIMMFNQQQQQPQLMQPPQGYAVMSASLEDHCSLPSSDIGEVDLDLWDLDINAPSVSPNSAGHLSPAVPPGRRSSDTSSTSGGALFYHPQRFPASQGRANLVPWFFTRAARGWRSASGLIGRSVSRASVPEVRGGIRAGWRGEGKGGSTR